MGQSPCQPEIVSVDIGQGDVTSPVGAAALVHDAADLPIIFPTVSRFENLLVWDLCELALRPFPQLSGSDRSAMLTHYHTILYALF